MKKILSALLVPILALSQDDYFDCSCPKKQWFQESSTSCQPFPETTKNCMKFRYSHLQENKANPECLYCDEGYFITEDADCISGKDKQIQENCELQYVNSQDKFVCVKCDEGYFLKESDGSCLQNPQKDENQNYVEGCGEYEGESIAAAVCTDCEKWQTQALNKEKTQCVEVPKEIENCHQHEYDAENDKWGCISCKDNYIESYAQDKCIEMPNKGDQYFVEFCTGYSVSNTDELRCSKCEFDYYVDFDEGKCKSASELEGFIDNCELYYFENGKVECQRCIDDHYSKDLKKDGCVQCPYIPKNGGDDNDANFGQNIGFGIGIAVLMIVFI